MKTLIMFVLITLVACGSGSSPEGRSKLRDETLRNEIDVLKNQNRAILDSIRLINKDLNEIKSRTKEGRAKN